MTKYHVFVAGLATPTVYCKLQSVHGGCLSWNAFIALDHKQAFWCGSNAISFQRKWLQFVNWFPFYCVWEDIDRSDCVKPFQLEMDRRLYRMRVTLKRNMCIMKRIHSNMLRQTHTFHRSHLWKVLTFCATKKKKKQHKPSIALWQSKHSIEHKQQKEKE